MSSPSQSRIGYLLEQVSHSRASPDELQELIELTEANSGPGIVNDIREYFDDHSVVIPEASPSEPGWQLILQRVLAVDRPLTTGSGTPERARLVHFLTRTWVRYAAAIMLVFGFTAYLWNSHKKTEQRPELGNRSLPTDVAPGRDRAILTLANGRQILLDSARGNILQQGNLKVVNLAGKLKYEGGGANTEYNTISTPKGGQYQVILPDGSKAWLNAASSIKFPTAFTGSTRNIEMKGEAYMEITKDPRRPFVVTANGTGIQVLGTSFNVNAYEDETAVRTTLIDGSVNVTNSANPELNSPAKRKTGPAVVRLKPGQQAVVGVSARQLTVVDNADIEQALAWKNGVFQLERASLAEIMRQLARWYDIEVVYENSVPDIKLGGEIKRDLNLSQILSALGKMGVKCRIEEGGKRLTVMQ